MVESGSIELAKTNNVTPNNGNHTLEVQKNSTVVLQEDKINHKPLSVISDELIVSSEPVSRVESTDLIKNQLKVTIAGPKVDAIKEAVEKLLVKEEEPIHDSSIEEESIFEKDSQITKTDKSVKNKKTKQK